jgi:hypothetical protein
MGDKARQVLADNAAAVVPDTLIHSEWFDKTTDRKRKIFVGARPYNYIKDQLSGKSSGRLPTGERIEFVQEGKPRRDQVTIMVDPAALDAAWKAADPGYYVPLGGEQKGGSRKRFEEFLEKGRPIEAPRVVLGKDGSPFFDNGRHRFAVLRDKGIDRIAVTVPKYQADKFRERFGAASGSGEEIGVPDWPHFISTSGQRLTLKQLQAESPDARAARVDAVRRQLAERRELLKQTATFGFLTGTQEDSNERQVRR